MPARIVSIALLVLFWVGLTDSASLGEVIAAALVTAAALTAYGVLRNHSELSTGARLRWVWQAARAWPVRILRDTVAALATAVHRKSPDGRFRRVAAGDASEIELAWTIVGTSISPTAYVIGLDDRRRTLLIHELIAIDRSDDELVWRPR